MLYKGFMWFVQKAPNCRLSHWVPFLVSFRRSLPGPGHRARASWCWGGWRRDSAATKWLLDVFKPQCNWNWSQNIPDNPKIIPESSRISGSRGIGLSRHGNFGKNSWLVMACHSIYLRDTQPLQKALTENCQSQCFFEMISTYLTGIPQGNNVQSW